eukprot:CAMPEP_0206454436 /NCGR_PEP_ID=MMETSP0324_2-20121206/21136_1 /ASSEMBLY_ACC=CAM_ASM_000836 /TAXON_ID=2866 /ORGANISM="Crypthecodinium cohnii, Strain Seligo" /LENGTH=536 /DNA_ID=CAMNT_0053924909 /DNA_START=169 /DNA_END=1776 /DNA_ORIENTATION=+
MQVLTFFRAFVAAWCLLSTGDLSLSNRGFLGVAEALEVYSDSANSEPGFQLRHFQHESDLQIESQRSQQSQHWPDHRANERQRQQQQRALEPVFLALAHKHLRDHLETRPDKDLRTTEGSENAVPWQREISKPTPPSPEARAYAISLMLAVVVVMCVFYLVNWNDDDVRANTWSTLSMTVSIFGAVLIFGTTVRLCYWVFNVKGLRGETFVLFVLFSVSFVVMQTFLNIMLRTQAHRTLVCSFGTICAHITGFAGMYCAAGLQVLPIFATTWWASCLLLAAITLALAGMFMVGSHLRRNIALADDGIIDEEEMRWLRQVEDAENDVFSLCLGFSIMQALRCWISGAWQPYDARIPPDHIGQSEANALLATSMALCILTAASTKLSHIGEEAAHAGLKRCCRGVTNVCSVAVAWCLLFWGEWQLYAAGFQGVRITGLLIVALSLTFLSFFAIVGLDLVADTFHRTEARGLRILMLSLGLMVGFTWERAFHIGFDALSLDSKGQYHESARLGLAAGLALLVLPAWSLYILPSALKAQE